MRGLFLGETLAHHASRARVLSCNDEVIRHIGLQEALEMIAAGQAIRVSRIKAKSLIIKLTAPRREERPSNQTSIKMSEMMANAGCMGVRRRNRARPDKVGNFVDRAMTKVQIWPLVHDTKAVRVGPRVV
jgi:hypothetical protein